MTNETLTSPVVQVLYMALNKPTVNKYSGKEEYSMRVMCDGSTQEGAAFKATLKAINNKLVGPQEPMPSVPQGYFTFNARSDFKPQVVDGEGTEVTEVPYFTKGSTGQAILTLKTFKSDKGGSVKLTGVAILDLNLTEAEPKENLTRNSLLDAINKVKKG